jgi:hypothetical protein
VYGDELEQDDIVIWAKPRGNPQGEEGASYILVHFGAGVSEDEAQELLASYPQLEISSEIRAPAWGKVIVPVGEEQTWIDTFQEADIVEYAELNYLFTITK